MKKLSALVVVCTSLFTSVLFGQGGNPGNLRIPGAFLGWNGTGPAGPLDIRNDFAGQPIRFYTNGFLRMTILDGGPGPGAGFVGINTATPNQLFTVRGGWINVTSPIGNTGYMLSSNAFPSDRVLWHNGDRTNIFVGVRAGFTGNAGGARTTMVGFNAGAGSVSSDDCVFIGANAGISNQVDGNVFVGSGCGISNASSSGLVFIGYQSGQSNTGGIQCTFAGYQSGQSNTTADYNTFYGFRAGRSNTVGQENTFIGNQTAMQCTNGEKNVAIGNNTGLELTSGIENVFVGALAAANNSTGSQNVVLGHDAAINSASIDRNVIIGEEAYSAPNAIGDANVIMGWRASDQMQVGADNVMIGHRVNPQTAAGSDNIFIGHLSGANVGGLTTT